MGVLCVSGSLPQYECTSSGSFTSTEEEVLATTSSTAGAAKLCSSRTASGSLANSGSSSGKVAASAGFASSTDETGWGTWGDWLRRYFEIDSPGRRIGSYPGGGPKSFGSATGSTAAGRVNFDSGIPRSPRRPPRPRRRRPRQPPRSWRSPEPDDSRGSDDWLCSSPETNSGWASLSVVAASVTG